MFKEFGLCGEPFNMYFNFCNTNNNISSVKDPINTINMCVNYSTSTMKKTTYYHTIYIYYINGFYYFRCLAQNSYYKKNIKGVVSGVYKVEENYISSALDEIFNGVEIL